VEVTVDNVAAIRAERNAQGRLRQCIGKNSRRVSRLKKALDQRPSFRKSLLARAAARIPSIRRRRRCYAKTGALTAAAKGLRFRRRHSRPGHHGASTSPWEEKRQADAASKELDQGLLRVAILSIGGRGPCDSSIYADRPKRTEAYNASFPVRKSLARCRRHSDPPGVSCVAASTRAEELKAKPEALSSIWKLQTRRRAVVLKEIAAPRRGSRGRGEALPEAR